jgi:hypothetical protein
MIESIKRRLLLGASLIPALSIEASAKTHPDMLQDSEALNRLMPVFLINHDVGSGLATVRCGLYSFADRRPVALRPGGFMRVNGEKMSVDHSPGNNDGYVGQATVGDSPKIVFELFRSFGESIKFSFSVPVFDLASKNIEYQGTGLLPIKFSRLEPIWADPKGLVDKFTLWITPSTLNSMLENSRRQDADVSEVDFRLLTGSDRMISGMFRSKIQRHANVPARLLSDRFAEGWMTFSVVQELIVVVR